jgi:O-antigen ligase
VLLAAVAIALTAVFVGSITERSAMWVGAIEYWLESPWIGFGPGTVADLLLQSSWLKAFLDDATFFPTDAHGFVIKLLPEIGLIGCLGFCAWLFRMFSLVVVSLRAREYNDYRINAASLAMLVSAVLMISVGTDTLTPRFWFVAALGIAVLRPMPVEKAAS